MHLKKFQGSMGLIMAALILMAVACKKDPVVIDDDPTGGKVKFSFLHKVNGQDAEFDTLKYINAAGNNYEINGIQYFISDITLHKSGGQKVVLSGNNEIHYTDARKSSTLDWLVNQTIPTGTYDSVTFTFGINAVKNKTGLFLNQPESNMMWDEILGGGYHYLKLDMKWMNPNNFLAANSFHIGIGQIYDNNGNITGFVQNYFTVKLPASSFTVAEGKITHIPIIMNIESWFETPNVYDFNYWGGAIMQNQDAMAAACQNGHDVFTTGIITII